MEYITNYESGLGRILLAGREDEVTGLWFYGQKYFAATLEAEHEEKELPVFAETKHWLDAYFCGKKPEMNLKLSPKGSLFRQEVWKILLEIPYGRVMTYGEIAGKMAERRGIKSMSAQAVGGAVGHNPISILVPCHRVVGTDGSLTGYAGGIEKKEWLLRLEKEVTF